jgi:hypothetical protein
MMEKDSISVKRLLPLVTQSCIDAQREAAQRRHLLKDRREARRYLKSENPHLFNFVIDSAHEICRRELLSEPMATYFREILFSQCGMVYNILRAQAESQQMDAIWNNDDIDKASA